MRWLPFSRRSERAIGNATLVRRDAPGARFSEDAPIGTPLAQTWSLFFGRGVLFVRHLAATLDACAGDSGGYLSPAQPPPPPSLSASPGFVK